MLAVMLGAGCATKDSYVTDYCLLAAPIIGSAADTVETLRQIEVHNAVYERICESE